MDKKLLIKKIKDLTKIHYERPIDKQSDYVLEEIKNLIDEYLAKNPEDTNVRLRLAMLEFTSPWEDPELVSKYLNEVLKYDPVNVYATLILAYMEYAGQPLQSFLGRGPRSDSHGATRTPYKLELG